MEVYLRRSTSCYAAKIAHENFHLFKMLPKPLQGFGVYSGLAASFLEGYGEYSTPVLAINQDTLDTSKQTEREGAMQKAAR